MIGDLALIGYPINAHIIASRPGTCIPNVQFAKKIKQYINNNKHRSDIPSYDPNKPAIYDINRSKNPCRTNFLSCWWIRSSK
ncbi:MAG: hypothetical protein QM743_10040 [Chitinophagaceae bacterium]